MFKINLSPQVREDSISVSVSGSSITINGQTFDLSPLVDGAALPRDAFATEFIVSDVTRSGNVIELTLLYPIPHDATEEQRFPQPIYVDESGQVVMVEELGAEDQAIEPEVVEE